MTAKSEAIQNQVIKQAQLLYFRLRKEVESPRDAVVVMLYAMAMLVTLNSQHELTGAALETFLSDHVNALRAVIQDCGGAITQLREMELKATGADNETIN